MFRFVRCVRVLRSVAELGHSQHDNRLESFHRYGEYPTLAQHTDTGRRHRCRL
jgi:hypothetical protein